MDDPYSPITPPRRKLEPNVSWLDSPFLSIRVLVQLFSCLAADAKKLFDDAKEGKLCLLDVTEQNVCPKSGETKLSCVRAASPEARFGEIGQTDGVESLHV
jgi:hypothetical protein